MSMIAFIIVGTLGGIGFNLYKPLSHKYKVFNIAQVEYPNVHGERIVTIPDTLHCEDLHYHQSSNLLFTACESIDDDPDARRSWFPPMHQLDAKYADVKGSLVVVDPKTFKSRALSLEGFSGPFMTHGIDIFEDPLDPSSLTIFAVNHVAHPDAASAKQKIKAASRVEVFEHTIGSSSAKWIRSVAHHTVETPNDIIATGKNHFYVTNDHKYRDGTMRMLEDLGWRGAGSWSTTMHVAFNPNTTSSDPYAEVRTVLAMKGLHNNNGLGRGAFPGEIVINSAASGEMTRASMSTNPKDASLKVLEHIKIESSIDNPSFYNDPYATTTNDASGYIIAGLTSPITLKAEWTDPEKVSGVVVWHVKLNEEYLSGKKLRKQDVGWDKNVIFRDDGQTISTAATAVLVGIDPKENGGKKQGWLFVTGMLSKNIVATLIDL